MTHVEWFEWLLYAAAEWAEIAPDEMADRCLDMAVEWGMAPEWFLIDGARRAGLI